MEDLYSVQENVHTFARGLLRSGEKQRQEGGVDQEEESTRPGEGKCTTEEKQQAEEEIG